MKIAVLGASGFLGNYIAKNLSDFEIIRVNRETINLLEYNHVRKWMLENSPDVIINCATSGGKTSNKQLGDFKAADLQNNIMVFLNFFNNSDLVKKFINIGSGAEFDINKNIDNISEIEIFNSIPSESYGFSKNIISRLIYEKKQFYTIRLFGIFDSSEPEFRFFKKILNEEIQTYIDRYFDYISAKDFMKTLTYYITKDDLPKDINCVYLEKKRLSEIISLIGKPINSNGINDKNYTGDAKNIYSLGIKFDGLVNGIQEYMKEYYE